MAKVYVWNVEKFGKRIEGRVKPIKFGEEIPVGAIDAEQFERLLETEQIIERTVKAKKAEPKKAPVDPEPKKSKKDKEGGK
jgi:hypothetical protein